MDELNISPLLRLPGELRNAIYMFAFQQPEKIIPEGRDNTNQLKLACRQLYHEAAWLELRYNDPITFVRQTYQQAEPSKQFLSFSENFPSKAFDYLNTVILTCAHDAILVDMRIKEALTKPPTLAFTRFVYDVAQSWAPPEGLVRLAELCRSHPNIRVRYILPSFHLDDLEPDDALHFVLEGISWTYAIRRVKPREPFMSWGLGRDMFGYLWCRALFHLQAMVEMSAEQLKQIPPISESVRYVTGVPRLADIINVSGGPARRKIIPADSRLYDSLRVDNLKFLPKCTNLDEAGFRKKLLQCRFSANPAVPFLVNGFISHGGLDKWVASARRWVEDGI